MDEPQQGRRRKRERSPSYPGIDLRAAIERAEVIRAHEGRSWVPIDAVLKHWGYSPKSGQGLVTLAALKKFGLLEEQGAGDHRQVRLTDLARSILLDEREDSPERLAAIRQAALMPTIHAELWHEYDGELPSDSNLSHQLRLRRGFTDGAARTFIGQFKDTLAFANLPESANMSDTGGDKPPPKEEGEQAHRLSDDALGVRRTSPPPPRMVTETTRAIQLPLSLDEWAILEAPFPLTEVKWKQMIAVLEAMKPALVGPSSPENVPTASAAPPVQQDSTLPLSLTPEAQELLKKVEDGGVPMFATDNLQRIARENGVTVSPEMTPNEIIAELQRH